MWDQDISRVKTVMGSSEVIPLVSAGLYPTLEMMEKFSNELPHETFAGLLVSWKGVDTGNFFFFDIICM